MGKSIDSECDLLPDHPWLSRTRSLKDVSPGLDLASAWPDARSGGQIYTES